MFERLKRWLLPAPPAKPQAPAANATSPADPPPAPTGSPGALVIDVRSEREFHTTAIEYAINVPLPQLAHRIAALATDKAAPLVLYCASGARSASACQVLRQLGYTNVTNAGGLYAAAAQLQREVRR